MDLDDPPVHAFGIWDAPATDGAIWIDVPTHLSCMHCRRDFIPGDNGLVNAGGWGQHRECSLRAVMGGIGHLVDHRRYCIGMRDPDAGLNYRQSAWLAWRHLTGGGKVTVEELEGLRALENAQP